MNRRKKIYEGKAKIIFDGPDPGSLVQYFKDDATAFNSEKHSIIEGKGVLNNMISEHVMNGLSNVGIPNHFIKRINMREQLVQSCEIIPLEVVVRNFAAGSVANRLDLSEGDPFARPIMECYLKSDKLGDPLLTDEHIAVLELATAYEMEEIHYIAFRVNDFLSGLMYAVGITLIDFKIEIGRVYKSEFPTLVVADEISPDTCRLWDSNSGRKLDKDVFRHDLGSLIDAYSEVAKRLGVLPNANLKRSGKPKLVH
ncbi:MAG: phosphoribosylaminoimidazolesuccinocarboxamide synthase [Roseovarius sp.]|nr:phosphoribosylaminoimidazolesuccinocarboxamide synthase [Roseovarius sp.]MCY4206506.1 phosphoribosylaminoimidazolesuccinocarboxamide synthase [Roseovarius sp.]MCY4315923.1 phosphoribosylaminoimidazolesuccinocarboxamide synthase [Roseovarius sp.]